MSRFASGTALAVLALLPIACVSEAGGTPGLKKDRDASVTRKLVPRDELPMPENWKWPEYARQLQGNDLSDSVGSEMLPPGWKWDRFHTGQDVTELLVSLNRKCPSGLVDIYNAGSSKEGRQLQVLRIGAKNDYATSALDELVPEVALSGNIHGDERASAEILLRLAWDLCRRFRHGDSEVIELLKTTSIHILPSMNPDGGEKRQRENADGRDLDTEFPTLGLPRTVGSQQAELPLEVLSAMNWHLDHPFVLSASIRGGALVASYPMDACDAQGIETDCMTEDDPLPERLARAFANAHGRMSDMPPAHESFDKGITRGSKWAPLVGSMQDWVWHATGSTELTLALHEDKDWDDSHAPRLPFLYLESKDALLTLAKQSHAAMKGRVTTSAEDGGRIEALDATVTLFRSGDEQEGRATTVQEAFGGMFFRLLVPGVEYCVEVAADGYTTQYAAVKLATPDEPDLAAEIMHAFRMSKNSKAPIAVLGDASEETCAALQQLRTLEDDGSGRQETRSGYKILELNCQDAEVVDGDDGSKQLTCVNYCMGVDMKPNIGAASGFRVTCDSETA